MSAHAHRLFYLTRAVQGHTNVQSGSGYGMKRYEPGGTGPGVLMTLKKMKASVGNRLSIYREQ